MLMYWQVYFINHRYDGVQLWQVRDVPGVHEFCWIMSFISFLFLYPSTFNLLEVAAVDKPKVHMYETGIMRITRHPQVIYLFPFHADAMTSFFFKSTFLRTQKPCSWTLCLVLLTQSKNSSA